MVRYEGFDRDGIRRVYGEHETSHEVAESRCIDEAKDYIERRRDTAPLAGWTFLHNVPRL